MSAPASSEIGRCIEAVGTDIFDAYTRNKFSEHILSLNYYTLSNASDWVDLKDFMKFSAPLLSNRPSVDLNTPQMPSSTVHSKSQSGSITSSPFPTPLADRRVKIEPRDINPFLHPGTPPTRSLVAQFHTAFDPSPAQKGISSSSSRLPQPRAPEGDVIEIFDSEDSDIPYKSTATRACAIKAPQKPVKSEKRKRDPSPGTMESGSEGDELVVQKNRKKSKKRSKKSKTSKRSARARTKRTDTINELQSIRENIQELTQIGQETSKKKKELRDQEKAIQEANGLKRSPHKQTSRGKSRLPHSSNIQDTNENPPPSQVLPPAAAGRDETPDIPASSTSTNVEPHEFGGDMTNVQPVASSSTSSFSQTSYPPALPYYQPHSAYNATQSYYAAPNTSAMMRPGAPSAHTATYYPQSYWQYPQPMYAYYIPPAPVSTSSAPSSEQEPAQPKSPQ